MKKKKSTSPKNRIVYPQDYNPILEYYEWIQANRTEVCYKTYRVYKELAQIQGDPLSVWEYSVERANHAIEFIENFCKHSKGKMGGKPVILELWEKAFIGAVFGYVHKIDRVRKHLEAVLIVAKKNGKSLLASAIGLYLMICDGEPGAEVYAVANAKDQAKIIWKEARSMVRKSPLLQQKIKTLVSEMVADFNDSIFKPLASDSDTLDGLNIHAGLLDEIHDWKTMDLYNIIYDGTIAREQPMILITSTAGKVREGPYDIKYEECTRVINGYDDPNGYKNERLLPVIYELDKREEWVDPKCWRKANPGLGTIKDKSQLAAKVAKAQANPLLVKNLICKDFNIRETVGEAWLTFEQLNNEATFDPLLLKPRYGIAGIDLSQTTDLTAASVIFMLRDDLTVYAMHMYWLPEDLLEKRTKEDKIPYDIWRDMGLLRTCPGTKVDPLVTLEWLKEVRDVYDIYLPFIGIDRWAAEHLKNELKLEFGAGTVEDVAQGKQTLSGPMYIMGADLESKIINYGNNPVTKWCLSNVAVDIDKNLNIQPCKTNNQRRRIDGAAALLDAYVMLERHRQDYLSLI